MLTAERPQSPVLVLAETGASIVVPALKAGGIGNNYSLCLHVILGCMDASLSFFFLFRAARGIFWVSDWTGGKFYHDSNDDGIPGGFSA